MSDQNKCSECGGRGVAFRGTGLDTQYKICSSYKVTSDPPNHPTLSRVMSDIRETIAALNTSGRTA